MESAPRRRPGVTPAPVTAHTVQSHTPVSAPGEKSSPTMASVPGAMPGAMPGVVIGSAMVGAPDVGVQVSAASPTGAPAAGVPATPAPSATPATPVTPASPAGSPARAADSTDASTQMPPGVPARWDVPAVALPRLLADAVRDFPEQIALAQRDGVEITHTQLAGLVDRLALALHARAIGRIVLVDPRPLAAVLVAQAAWRLGIPIVLGTAVVDAEHESVQTPDQAVDHATDGDTQSVTDPADGGHDAEEVVDEAVTVAGAPAAPESTTLDGDPTSVEDDATAREDAGREADGELPDTDDVSGILARIPDWDAAHDVAVGARRSLASLGVPSARMVVDDLTRLSAGGEVGGARLVHGFRRIVRQLGHRDRASLTGMVEVATQGALPTVSPDAIAVVHQTEATRHEFTHHNLVAAAFQVRLWIPDMAAGTERVAAAMSLRDPVAFVVGPVLAVLTGATLRCDEHPTTTIAGATVAFGSVELWREIARRPRRSRQSRQLSRGDGSPSSLRVGGIVTTGASDLLPPADVRAIVALTQGARLRHFWTSAAAAGPVAAQPVYGRVLGMPGAEALTETMLQFTGRQVLAAGPQFARTGQFATPSWTVVTGAVPPPATAPRKDMP